MPRCKCCKIKFKAKYFNQKFCLEKDECLLAHVEYSKEQQLKRNRKERKAKLPELYPKKYRGYLQDEINKLARKIDAKLGHTTCIDCGKTLIGIKQVDGAHFTSVGSNTSIRYNLHNIHSAASDCNFYSDTHHKGYEQGIIKRYSKAYLDRIEGLKLEYKVIKLTNKEVAEKLAMVRKLNRDFETFEFDNGISARDCFNMIIGIYN